jgi:hypothetical protein
MAIFFYELESRHYLDTSCAESEVGLADDDAAAVDAEPRGEARFGIGQRIAEGVGHAQRQVDGVAVVIALAAGIGQAQRIGDADGDGGRVAVEGAVVGDEGEAVRAGEAAVGLVEEAAVVAWHRVAVGRPRDDAGGQGIAVGVGGLAQEDIGGRDVQILAGVNTVTVVVGDRRGIGDVNGDRRGVAGVGAVTGGVGEGVVADVAAVRPVIKTAVARCHQVAVVRIRDYRGGERGLFASVSLASTPLAAATFRVGPGGRAPALASA